MKHDDIFAVAGEVVTCPNDHAIAIIKNPLKVSGHCKHEDFDFMNGNKGEKYQEVNTCVNCGRAYTSFINDRLKLHIRGRGWVPEIVTLATVSKQA